MLQKINKPRRLKKWQLILATIVLLALAGLMLYRRINSVEIFVDSAGITWRVLTEDANGNRLIITEYVQGGTQYNTTDIFTPLSQSDGMRPALDAWFADMLAPELKELALPTENVDSDVRIEAKPIDGFAFYEASGALRNEREPAGLTTAGAGEATPENSLFILSISEVNEYLRRGTLNMQSYFYGGVMPTSWWLRSPGTRAGTVSMVWWRESERRWHFDNISATVEVGFRPALWIQPSQS